MEEALAGYIVFLKEQERSETTVNKYRHDIETFLAWNMHAPVTKERVISYKHWLTERYAPASVNSMLAALNGFLRYAGHGDYSGRSAHALKRVQRTGIAVQQSSAAVQPRPLGMG